MKNEKQPKTNKTKVPAPYSSEYIASQLKSIFVPLLKMKNVVKKYSPIVPGFVEFCENEVSINGECIEDDLFRRVHCYTYGSLFKSINNNLILLFGQLILREDIDIIQIDKHLLKIRENLYNIYEIGRKVCSWLYDDKDYHHSEDYAELFDNILNAQFAFDKIYQDYQNSNKSIEPVNLDNLDPKIKKYECKLKSVYKKLLKFTSKVLQLENENNNYKYIFCKFASKLAKILFFKAGEFYMSVNSYKNIQFNLKSNITDCFKELEISLSKNVFCRMSNCYSDIPIYNAIMTAYEDLKQEISKNGLCELKCKHFPIENLILNNYIMSYTKENAN